MTNHIDYMSGYAGGRKFTAIERLLISAATHDHDEARRFYLFGSRLIPANSISRLARSRGQHKNISGTVCVVDLWPGRNLTSVFSAPATGNPPIATEPEERPCVHTSPFRVNRLVTGT